MDALTVRNGEVNLHVTVDGEGPLVLLLHGWPDTSALWDEVAPKLIAAGFRVAVPDLRGCGQSDKPSEVDDYRMHHLVSDVVSIVDALGGGKVTLVGHDWGAALAWAVAAYRGDLVERLVVLSVGHPTAFYGAGISQQIKSWYMLLFQFEGVGEAFLRKNDYEAMRRWTGHPRAEAVIKELERDGQMRTHLLWYRANVAPNAFVGPLPVLPAIEVPVLGIWSSGDFALGEGQMIDSGNYCANGFRYVRLEGAGHWIPLEAASSVSREVVSFCSNA
ncbi:MAG TPA: alpha/beta fold hydrolase [Acidimicrobiales bacterium]|jgi:pimeloyl-ACP methyl ester carboxylesterase|nr:alpha/beta fold hydrolase [Acidimicrobiales bacterium]